eukprot:scaffold186238_cov14-Tisochrysis_lutea.AAC.1
MAPPLCGREAAEACTDAGLTQDGGGGSPGGKPARSGSCCPAAAAAQIHDSGGVQLGALFP